jgi:hypothetical protein
MKKVLFSAAAFLAMAGTSYAANAEKEISEIEILKELVAPCSAVFEITDNNNKVIAYEGYVSNTTDFGDCQDEIYGIRTRIAGAYGPGYYVRVL